MPMNRVQFQPGLSMPEFVQQFGTEAQCEAALQAARSGEAIRLNAKGFRSTRWASTS